MKCLCLYSNFYQINKRLVLNRYSCLRNRMINFLVCTLQDILHSALCLNETINWILIVYHTLITFITQKSNWISQLWTQTGIGSCVIQVFRSVHDYWVFTQYILKKQLYTNMLDFALRGEHFPCLSMVLLNIRV